MAHVGVATPAGEVELRLLRSVLSDKHLHRNAVNVNGTTVVGSLKSNKNRVVVLPGFVIDTLSEIARGKGRDDLFMAVS